MNLLHAPSAILISTGQSICSPRLTWASTTHMKRVTRLVVLHALTTQFSHHQSLAPFRLDECASQSMNSRVHRVFITGMSGWVPRNSIAYSAFSRLRQMPQKSYQIYIILAEHHPERNLLNARRIAKNGVWMNDEKGHFLCQYLRPHQIFRGLESRMRRRAGWGDWHRRCAVVCFVSNEIVTKCLCILWNSSTSVVRPECAKQ